MGWFKRKPLKPAEPPTLVRFANGKYGVRRRSYDGADYHMLDMRGDNYWWSVPKHWPDNAQADAATAVARLEAIKRPVDADDVGVPV